MSDEDKPCLIVAKRTLTPELTEDQTDSHSSSEGSEVEIDVEQPEDNKDLVKYSDSVAPKDTSDEDDKSSGLQSRAQDGVVTGGLFKQKSQESLLSSGVSGTKLQQLEKSGADAPVTEPQSAVDAPVTEPQSAVPNLKELQSFSEGSVIEIDIDELDDDEVLIASSDFVAIDTSDEDDNRAGPQSSLKDGATTGGIMQDSYASLVSSGVRRYKMFLDGTSGGDAPVTESQQGALDQQESSQPSIEASEVKTVVEHQENVEDLIESSDNAVTDCTLAKDEESSGAQSSQNDITTGLQKERTNGDESVVESQQGGESVVESQQGDEIVVEYQKGGESVVESQKGGESVVESQQGGESVVESQQGGESVVESQQDDAISNTEYEQAGSADNTEFQKRGNETGELISQKRNEKMGSADYQQDEGETDAKESEQAGPSVDVKKSEQIEMIDRINRRHLLSAQKSHSSALSYRSSTGDSILGGSQETVLVSDSSRRASLESGDVGDISNSPDLPGSVATGDPSTGRLPVITGMSNLPLRRHGSPESGVAGGVSNSPGSQSSVTGTGPWRITADPLPPADEFSWGPIQPGTVPWANENDRPEDIYICGLCDCAFICDYMRPFSRWIRKSIVFLCVRVVLILASLITFTMGMSNLKYCPMKAELPILVALLGMAGMIVLVISLAFDHRNSGCPNAPLGLWRAGKITTRLTFLILFICVLTSTYHNPPSFDPSHKETFCSVVFYNFTYYANILIAGVVALAFIIYLPSVGEDMEEYEQL